MHRLRRSAAAALVAVGVMASACREEGAVKVIALTFDGVEAFDEAVLKNALRTRASGPFPWSAKAYFDRAVFEADLVRIRQFYDERGFPDARVTSVDVALNERRDAVRLTVVVDEGNPVVVARTDVTGTERLNPDVAGQLSAAVVGVGEPRSRLDVAAARQRMRAILHDNGYAYGEVDASESTVDVSRGVVVTFDVRSGPATVFGAIDFTGLSSIDERLLRRQLSFRPGQAYSERLVTDSQRRLGALELLRFVNVNARPPQGQQPAVIPVVVTIAESPPRRFQLGIGYGTEEQARGSVEWSHLNALGRGDRFTAAAKYSSLDRGVRVGLTQPYLLRRGLSLDVSGSTWWSVEPSYRSRTYGGRAGVAYRWPGGARGADRVTGDVVRVAYVHEFLSYTVPDDVLDDPGNFGTLLALGLNPTTGNGRGTKSAVELSYERASTDRPLDPTRGYGVAARVDYARPWLGGGTFHYTEYIGEARGYVPLGARLVLAGRARSGRLVAANDNDVPFSERYFLGGASSLRGWGRYEVAPLSDGFPIGGRTSFDVTLEARLKLRGPLGIVGFFDAGNVWSGNPSIDFSALRRDAGIGVRYSTPVGLVRGDIGFQINPIDGLVIDGEQEQRHWRLHVSIGQAF